MKSIVTIMNFRQTCLLVGFSLIFCTLQGQVPASSVEYNDDIPITENNALVDMPFVGGLGHPLYSNGDLNNDGIDDLFIFDAYDNTSHCFIRSSGFLDFSYERTLSLNFPKLSTWAMLADYNCDNIPDLFTPTLEEGDTKNTLDVYSGSYDSQGLIQFTLAYSILTYDGGQEMFSLAEHFPAITDVDADGDLDILAYKSSSGTQVVFFRNISEDCDDLEFTLDTDCFGDFNDNTFIPLDLNAGCDNFTGGGSGETALHGVSSLLYSDADGDGLKDLFIGNEYYNNITVLYNDGTTDSCHFYAQDNSWPSATTPVTLTALPTGMELDLNLDGEPSIVFSVRGNAAGENYSCSQLYQKNMAGEYDLNSSTFFTPYMMDCGSYSYPVFFDYNNDGLMDIVVGNLGYYDPTLAYRGSLTLYENVGTLEEPSFELIDRDYLGLSVLQKRYFAPAFGDLDGDGDQDLLLGLEDGKMYFFNNVPSGDLIPSFIPISPNFEGLDVGSHASPQIVDLDHDGLLDLLIGTKVGYLVFYKNIGTVTSPSFAEGVVQVGNVDTRTAETVTGYAAPFASDIETPGEFLLYCGSESGEIFRYNDIEENLEAGESFTLIDSLFAGIDPGARSKISIADIDMDGFPEMVIGNSRGGLSFLDLGMDSMVSTTQLHPSDMGLEIYPNPNFEGSFNIKFKASSPTDLDVQVYDLDGRLLSSTSTLQHDFIKVKMNVEYPSGIYIVQVYSDEKVYTGKINFQ